VVQIGIGFAGRKSHVQVPDMGPTAHKVIREGGPQTYKHDGDFSVLRLLT
jgi:hypothetical protein